MGPRGYELIFYRHIECFRDQNVTVCYCNIKAYYDTMFTQQWLKASTKQSLLFVQEDTIERIWD